MKVNPLEPLQVHIIVYKESLTKFFLSFILSNEEEYDVLFVKQLPDEKNLIQVTVSSLLTIPDFFPQQEIVVYVHGNSNEAGEVKHQTRTLEHDAIHSATWYEISYYKKTSVAEKINDLWEKISEQNPLYIGTDGSFNLVTKKASYAWVSSEGEYSFGRVKRAENINEAELYSIYEALKDTQYTDAIRIIETDSMNAWRFVKALTENKLYFLGENNSFARFLFREISSLLESSHNDVAIHWVKGHAGHPLNDRADRLALFSLRMLKHKFGGKSSMEGVVSNIIEGVADEAYFNNLWEKYKEVVKVSTSEVRIIWLKTVKGEKTGSTE